MKSIAFIDTEIDVKTQKVQDIGSIKSTGAVFHGPSMGEFMAFLEGSQFICGHNIIKHDLKYIRRGLAEIEFNPANIIDTLYLSPLLFPAKPYHALLKDDKLQTEERNNPLNDAIKAKDLFFDEISAFQQVDNALQKIFYHLLKDEPAFSAFFAFIGFEHPPANITTLIREKFKDEICEHAVLDKIVEQFPIALSYCLALINTKNRFSITPRWVLKNHPDVERIMYLLKNNACLTGCGYCNQAMDIHRGLKRFFRFDA